MDHWSRRQFVQGVGVVSLGLLAGCGRLPLSLGERRPVRLPRVGYLALGSATADEAFRESFSQGMQAHGWVQGENVTLEWRFADGDMERLPTLVAELVRLPVDVLVTQAFATVVARRETSSIPIVMVGVV